MGWTSFGSTRFESSSSTSLPHPVPGSGFASMPAGVHGVQQVPSRSVCRLMSIPVSSRIASLEGDPPPRRREVDRLPVALDLERPDRLAGHRRHQLLGHRRHVQVVRVGLVGLEHRELRVVLVGDALVAEVLAELVDLLEAAHDQPLQVELGRDPQVQGAVEHVVMRREGTGQRAAVQGLQHRSLDLEKPPLV